MDTCKHVLKICPAADHSILNPQKWHCQECATTESVWACLSCPYVACGRYIEEHALSHYKETKHPLAVEVNDKYVYCYECEDYVLNDNAAGDLKLLRDCLSAITTQSFTGVGAKSSRLLRSYSFQQLSARDNERRLREEDLNYTALWFRRYYVLAKAFSAWKQNRSSPKSKRRKTAKLVQRSESVSSVESLARRRTPLLPGVTGLRNLGNTCYMNSVLQTLSNVVAFRRWFLQQDISVTSQAGKADSAPAARSRQHRRKRYMRQTTMDCFQHLNEGSVADKKGGLNGGSSSSCSKKAGLGNAAVAVGVSKTKIFLCEELHALLRVMWSGKWALVSPHKMLHAVWAAVPFFRGYTQQDAQEFLCEFLDKVQSQLEKASGHSTDKGQGHRPGRSIRQGPDIITELFQGELRSQVRCKACGHKSHTSEPFMDLSLEFPDRYHCSATSKASRACADTCHIKDLLTKFTERESLEGRIYACQQCNARQQQPASSRKRPARPSTSTVYTEAEKCLVVSKLPRVLRLHLKRFMWGGRNHRGKIVVHVDFDRELDMRPFCQPGPRRSDCSYVYQLSAVVMHHGLGFGSGHYTAYCWNTDAGSWVHCNDAKVELCDIKDAYKAQAYILFYTQKDKLDQDEHEVPAVDSLFEESVDSEIVFNYRNSTIPKFVELKRRASQDAQGRFGLKRRKTTVW